MVSIVLVVVGVILVGELNVVRTVLCPLNMTGHTENSVNPRKVDGSLENVHIQVVQKLFAFARPPTLGTMFHCFAHVQRFQVERPHGILNTQIEQKNEAEKVGGQCWIEQSKDEHEQRGDCKNVQYPGPAIEDSQESGET